MQRCHPQAPTTPWKEVGAFRGTGFALLNIENRISRAYDSMASSTKRLAPCYANRAVGCDTGQTKGLEGITQPIRHLCDCIRHMINNARFEKLILWLGVASALLFLFLPLLLLDLYKIPAVSHVPNSSEESTVGIAIVARATTRRVFSTTMSNVLGPTLTSFSRAAARTFVSRLIRFIGCILFGVLAAATGSGRTLEAPSEDGDLHPFFVIALGSVVLALSLYGVLYVAGPEATAAVTSGGVLSYPVVALLAGLPLAVYGLIHWLMGKFLGLTWRINTALDGMLLQIYFTGAGIFVPMATDIEYFGTTKENMRAAAISLTTMFAIHLALGRLGSWGGSPVMSFASAMFLLYCFVHAFPIRPLEGYDVWRESKLLWLCLFLPILVAFLVSLPESFTGLFGILPENEIAS